MLSLNIQTFPQSQREYQSGGCSSRFAFLFVHDLSSWICFKSSSKHQIFQRQHHILEYSIYKLHHHHGLRNLFWFHNGFTRDSCYFLRCTDCTLFLFILIFIDLILFIQFHFDALFNLFPTLSTIKSLNGNAVSSDHEFRGKIPGNIPGECFFQKFVILIPILNNFLQPEIHIYIIYVMLLSQINYFYHYLISPCAIYMGYLYVKC